MEDKINILGLNFHIKEVDCIEHGSLDIGRIDHINQIIYLKKGMSKERKKVVLIHEALHSIFQQLGFSEEHDDEHLIDCLAKSIDDLLRNNDNLISF